MTEHNNYKCPACRAEIQPFDPAHNCGGWLTVYRPNIGKLTRQIDPAYRKRAGSRPVHKYNRLTGTEATTNA